MNSSSLLNENLSVHHKRPTTDSGNRSATATGTADEDETDGGAKNDSKRVDAISNNTDWPSSKHGKYSSSSSSSINSENETGRPDDDRGGGGGNGDGTNESGGSDSDNDTSAEPTNQSRRSPAPHSSQNHQDFCNRSDDFKVKSIKENEDATVSSIENDRKSIDNKGQLTQILCAVCKRNFSSEPFDDDKLSIYHFNCINELEFGFNS